MLSEFGFDRCEELGLSARGGLDGDACGPGQQRCGFVVAAGVEHANGQEVGNRTEVWSPARWKCSIERNTRGAGDGLLDWRGKGVGMVELPTGTVTFLFTDIEGSTRLWEEHPEPMRAALAQHDEVLRDAVESHDGVVFSTMGDGIAAAFVSAPEAIAGVLDAQQRGLRPGR
jgi:class 3 adenylate cyclase